MNYKISTNYNTKTGSYNLNTYKPIVPAKAYLEHVKYDIVHKVHGEYILK